MHWIVEHWQENIFAIVVAIVFAMVFAIVADAMSIGSRVREGLRRFKNKRAEKSLTRISERIDELEQRRKMLSSRTAVVLLALQATLRTLGLISAGLFAIVLRDLDLPTFIGHFGRTLAHMITSHSSPLDFAPSPILSNMLRAEIWLGGMFFLLLGTSSAKAGLDLARVDREERFAKAINQLDDEIRELKKKQASFVGPDNRAISPRDNAKA